MSNLYQIKTIKNGVVQTQHRVIDGDLDEMHIVSMQVIRQNLAEEMEQRHRAESFKEMYLPATVFFGAFFLMALIVLNNWGVL